MQNVAQEDVAVLAEEEVQPGKLELDFRGAAQGELIDVLVLGRGVFREELVGQIRSPDDRSERNDFLNRGEQQSLLEGLAQVVLAAALRGEGPRCGKEHPPERATRLRDPSCQRAEHGILLLRRAWI